MPACKVQKIIFPPKNLGTPKTACRSSKSSKYQSFDTMVIFLSCFIWVEIQDMIIKK